MKKFPKILILLLSAVFAITSFTACSDLGETLNTLGEVADLATEVLEDINNSDISETPPEADEPQQEIGQTQDEEPEPSYTELTESELPPEDIAEAEDPEEPEVVTPEDPEPEESKNEEPDVEPEEEPEAPQIAENGSYTTKEDVALYIHTYGKLPENFITKNEARALGWEGGGLDGYANGKCIGGDKFGNYEGFLPKAKGRTYTECDIDTLGKKSRGAKRIVFSNDGLIYYTGDHYETFELLYGNE